MQSPMTERRKKMLRELLFSSSAEPSLGRKTAVSLASLVSLPLCSLSSSSSSIRLGPSSSSAFFTFSVVLVVVKFVDPGNDWEDDESLVPAAVAFCVLSPSLRRYFNSGSSIESSSFFAGGSAPQVTPTNSRVRRTTKANFMTGVASGYFADRVTIGSKRW